MMVPWKMSNLSWQFNPGVGCYPLAELSESARPCVTTCDSLFIRLLCWFVRMSLDQNAIMVTPTNLRQGCH